MKKLLLVFLTLLCVATCAIGLTACGNKEESNPLPAYLYDFMDYRDNASGNYTIDGRYFFVDNQFMRDLEEYGLDKLEELTIPDTYTKHDITAPIRVIKMIMLPALKKINLPEGIVAIEKQAFQFCPELEEINLPSTLEYIGPDAFAGTKIKEITIPAGLTNVDGFANCANLKKVTFLGEEHTLIGNGSYGTFSGCTALEEIDFSCITEIGGGAFSGCTSLKKVTINGDATIRSGAFGECTALEDVTFTPYEGDGLFLESGIFRNVTLEHLTVPKFTRDTHNENSTFANDPLSGCKIRHLTFTEATEITGFGDASELVELNLNEGVTDLFHATNSVYGGGAVPLLKELTIPSTVTHIGQLGGFRSLEKLNWNAVDAKCYRRVGVSEETTQPLTENTGADGTGIVVKFGDKVESIPDMFKNSDGFYTNATNVIAVLAEDAKLDSISFQGMIKLRHVELPKTLKSIGSYFLENTQVMELTIPASVTSIANYAFLGCSKLTDVINLSSVSITNTSKDGIVPEINILTSADDIEHSKLIRYYNYLFYERGYNDYVLLGSDSYEDLSPNDVLDLPNAVYDGRKNNAPKIADTYTLAEGAFFGRHECAVIMPTFNSGSSYSIITEIPKYCFAYSKIRQVLSPRPADFVGTGVKIGAYAFGHCDHLTSFDFSEVAEVDKDAFKYVKGWDSSSTSNIAEITLPAGCDYLGDLFTNTRFSPTEIVYKGTVSSWLTLNNRPTYSGYTVYCTDGEVSSDGTVTTY